MSKYLCADCGLREQCDCEWTMRCSRYVPKEYKQTNEDWIKQSTTEQLADVFFDYRYINATPQQQLWLSANEDFVKGGIVKWLKQPHGGES